jgi:hypothetical protein
MDDTRRNGKTQLHLSIGRGLADARIERGGPSLEHERREGNDGVTAHRAVALVVQEEHIEVRILRGRDHCAVHVRMPTGFPHQPSAQMIEVLAEITTLLEHGPAWKRWQAARDHPQRFAAGVQVDGRNSARVW